MRSEVFTPTDSNSAGNTTKPPIVITAIAIAANTEAVRGNAGSYRFM